MARSNVNMNYDGLKKLRDQLAKIDRTDEFFNACAKELAARLLAKAIKRTPVGDYRTFTRNTRSGGVLSLVLGDFFDIMPKNINVDNSNSANYYCDYSWANSTGQLLLFGGSAWAALGCGSFCVSSDDGFGVRYTNFGVRLAFYGNPTYVNGADL